MKLLILGASVRSLVCSAVCAGFSGTAIDLFADWDVSQSEWVGKGKRFSIKRADPFESMLQGIAWTAFDGVIVSGGIENRIPWMREIEQNTQLLGPSSRNLARLLDSVEVMHRLATCGITTPDTRDCLTTNDPPGEWLVKPYGGSGGEGIRLAEAYDCGSSNGNVFFQARIEGEHYSALFVSARSNGEGDRPTAARLIGVTRQLVGKSAQGAAPFCYCGSIGPIRLPLDQQQQIESCGNHVAQEYGMEGVWGIDFVVNQQGVWPVDINPRITASAELFESMIRDSGPDVSGVSGVSGVLELHVNACLGIKSGELKRNRDHHVFTSEAGLIEGKAILFNRFDVPVAISPEASSELRCLHELSFFSSSKPGMTLADIPQLGTLVEPGAPILTIRMRARGAPELVEGLKRQSENVFALLARHGSSRPVG